MSPHADRCWCGTRRPYRETSPALLSSYCAGTGELDCLCGGDQCVCHNHGTVECEGCYACAAPTGAMSQD